MRISKHPRSVALFSLVAIASVATALLLGGGSSRGEYNKYNTDQRSVMVEVVLVEQTGNNSDPVLADLLDTVRPEGGARMLTAAEFDKARAIASSVASPSVLRTPTLVSQHNETSSAVVTRPGGHTARVAVTPTVLDDDVLRVALDIGHTVDGTESSVELRFTSRGGAAMACESFATQAGPDGRANGSAVLLVRPTLVVEKN